MDLFYKLTGRIDARSARNEGDANRPVWRENYLTRDDRIVKPGGTRKAIDTTLDDTATWIDRYFSSETGASEPVSLVYSQDGKIWIIDELARTATEKNDLLNEDAYPNSWIYKTGYQNIMYFVDGLTLYKYDGNLDYKFQKVKLEDADGLSVLPIDVIEHRDRLCVISNNYLYVSKNLEPDVFDSATDSLQVVVGSGKGKNLGLAKIEDVLFIFNTEGIFRLSGDVISAVASTFSIDKVDNHKILAGRTAVEVEQAILFLGTDGSGLPGIFAWDGVNAQKLSHDEKLEDYINMTPTALKKAVATYEDNYYKLSVVEKGEVNNKLEFWWDALNKKVEPVRGRNVSCYVQTDPTIEEYTKEFTRSDIGSVMYADETESFDGEIIVSKVRSRDFVPKKGYNCRFTAFYPVIEPSGDGNILFRYYLDGRLGWTNELGEQRIGWFNTENSGEMCTLASDYIGTFFTAQEDMSITHVKAKLNWIDDSLTMTYRAAIYEYNAGSPGAVLGTSDTKSLTNTVLAMHTETFEFSTPVALEAGTKYGIAIQIVSGTPTTGLIARYGSYAAESFNNIAGSASTPTDRSYDIYAYNEQTAEAEQSLDGEVRSTGGLLFGSSIKNQAQFTDRIKPKIKYSRGESISFEINDDTPKLQLSMLGIGLDFIVKTKKKGRAVGK